MHFLPAGEEASSQHTDRRHKSRQFSAEGMIKDRKVLCQNMSRILEH